MRKKMESDAWNGEVRIRQVKKRKLGEASANMRKDSRGREDRGSKESVDRSRKCGEIG